MKKHCKCRNCVAGFDCDSDSESPPSPPCTRYDAAYFGTEVAVTADGLTAAASGIGSSNFGNFAWTYNESYTAIVLPNSFAVLGTRTETYSDGSSLFIKYTGSYIASAEFTVPGVISTYFQDIVVQSGTGRFQGATGESFETGTCILTDVATGAFDLTWFTNGLVCCGVRC